MAEDCRNRNCSLFCYGCCTGNFSRRNKSSGKSWMSADNCGGSSLLVTLSKGAGANLLKKYGYNLCEPWTCSKIESSWTAGATISRFQKITVQSDDHAAFSVAKVPGFRSVWVIPTATGMLEVAHAESDPHNMNLATRLTTASR